MRPRIAVLETRRLVLYELEGRDLEFVAAMLSNPEVSRFYPKRFDRADAEVWLERQLERYRRDGHGLWLAWDKALGAPVGQVGLAMQEVEGRLYPEVGWLLDRPFWGKGYATEAGGAARDAAFGLWGYSRVISLIRPENTPSCRVASRIGMTPGPRVEFHGFTHIEFSQEAEGTPSGTSRGEKE